MLFRSSHFPMPVRWLLLNMLSLNIRPVVTSSGRRLFDQITHQVRLKLVHLTILSTGVIGAAYQPDRAGSGVSESPISFPQAAARK
jgi:hypothetical protein